MEYMFEENKPLITISSVLLLILLNYADNVHIDAIYKLINCGFPVVVVETTDYK